MFKTIGLAPLNLSFNLYTDRCTRGAYVLLYPGQMCTDGYGGQTDM